MRVRRGGVVVIQRHYFMLGSYGVLWVEAPESTGDECEHVELTAHMAVRIIEREDDV